MMLRVSLAAAFLLGGSLTAALAASDPAPAEAQSPVPAVAVADDTQPRFEPSQEEFSEAFVAFGAKPEAPISDTPAAPAEPAEDAGQELGSGVASWYGAEFAGRKTASGERFDPAGYTAAHRTLPFGSRVRVSMGGKSVIVRINDRGPFSRGRVIDLSRAAADELGLVRRGSGRVTLSLLDRE